MISSGFEAVCALRKNLKICIPVRSIYHKSFRNESGGARCRKSHSWLHSSRTCDWRADRRWVNGVSVASDRASTKLFRQLVELQISDPCINAMRYDPNKPSILKLICSSQTQMCIACLYIIFMRMVLEILSPKIFIISVSCSHRSVEKQHAIIQSLKGSRHRLKGHFTDSMLTY